MNQSIINEIMTDVASRKDALLRNIEHSYEQIEAYNARIDGLKHIQPALIAQVIEDMEAQVEELRDDKAIAYAYTSRYSSHTGKYIVKAEIEYNYSKKLWEQLVADRIIDTMGAETSQGAIAFENDAFEVQFKVSIKTPPSVVRELADMFPEKVHVYKHKASKSVSISCSM